MSQLDERYQKDPAMVSRQIAGEVILVPIRKNVGDLESIYTLNDTAACAWALFDGQHTLAKSATRWRLNLKLPPMKLPRIWTRW